MTRSECLPGHSGKRGAFPLGAAYDELVGDPLPDAQPYRLRHVIPLGAQLANGTWIVAVQVHDDCFIVEWVNPASLREERVIEYAKGVTDIGPIEHPEHRFSVEDDLGTEYA